jgi:dihydroxyacetone kinase
VKNYTGDRLNFGLAAELARAEGIPVEMVIVADDVAARCRRARPAARHRRHRADSQAGRRRRRTRAAARARRGRRARGGRRDRHDGRRAGWLHDPGADKSGFSLADHEIELGLGIHGEKGVERTAPLPADALVETLLSRIVADLVLDRGERVALLVNGLGATPDMELAIVRAAYDNLTRRGITVARAWAGTFLSALNMPGCSISRCG